jgi:hypothetical protein
MEFKGIAIEGRVRRCRNCEVKTRPHARPLPPGASPPSLHGASRDFAPALRRECFGSRGATLYSSEPPQRDGIRVPGGDRRTKHSNPLRRRVANRAGRPDFVRTGRLDEVAFRVTDQAAPPDEALGGWETGHELFSSGDVCERRAQPTERWTSCAPSDLAGTVRLIGSDQETTERLSSCGACESVGHSRSW